MTSGSVPPSSEGATTLPWPRFRDAPSRPRVTTPAVGDRWPRWGSLPEVPRAEEPPASLDEPLPDDEPLLDDEEAPPAFAEASISERIEEPSDFHEAERTEEPAQREADEQPRASASTAERDVTEGDDEVEARERRGPTLLPVRRSVALVPRRRDLSDVTLGEVAQAAKKLAPAAIAGAAAAALVTLFRRR